MDRVGIATLHTKPWKVPDLGSISPLWLGEGTTQSGGARMYLKAAPVPEILAECICAVAGSALGLPVPPLYLVLDPAKHTDHPLLIGSKDVGVPSLRQRSILDDAAMQQTLCRWDALHRCAIFDEWIANPDRNQGNLLWNGQRQWYLIDHARALGLADPADSCDNILAAAIAHWQRDLGLLRMQTELLPFARDARAIDLGNIRTFAQCDVLGIAQHCDAALSFLRERIGCLPMLLSRHNPSPIRRCFPVWPRASGWWR
jgi:hypothetical protein